MADIFRNENAVSRRTDWSAIWSGMFIFLAVWSVFALLGMLIFSSVETPAFDATLRTGMSVGMGIWCIVFAAVAMYVAGLETGRLAAAGNRNGITHGCVMFGLSIVAMALISFGGVGLAGIGVAAARAPYLLNIFAGFGWVSFIALLLGWLAAMGGAAQSSTGIRRSLRDFRDINRPAA